MSIDLAQLWGTWNLISWTLHLSRDSQLGPARYPFGENALGKLTYTPEGRVWAVLMKRDRPLTDAPALYAASEAQRAELAAGYVSYGGTYRLQEDPGGVQVVHAVEFSLFSNWIGTELRRTAELQDGRLVLQPPAQSTPSGRTIQHTLTWRKEQT